MENLLGSLHLHLSDLVPEKLVGGKGISAPVDSGVLPLATALGYAMGVAAALRERRGEIPAQSNGGPDHVGPLGAVPHPSEPSSRQAEKDSDMVAFGALLYELMTGSKPPQDVSQFVVPSVPLVGAEGVRMAATRLSLRCMAGDPQGMQRILTELRLYSVMARQGGWRTTDSVTVGPGHPSNMPPRGNPVSEASGEDPSISDHSPTLLISADQTQSPPYCEGQCPACGGSFIHRSRPRTPFEYLLTATGISLNRCQRCLYRYVVILGIAFTKRPRHVRRRSPEGGRAVAS
jgi:hypothetical protein